MASHLSVVDPNLSQFLKQVEVAEYKVRTARHDFEQAIKRHDPPAAQRAYLAELMTAVDELYATVASLATHIT